MIRLMLGIGLAASLGCNGIQPAGPFAKMSGNSTGTKSKAGKARDNVVPPITVPAVKPTPPTNLIYADEVSAENPQASIQKLKNELDTDAKNIPAAPMTAEVSRYKGGVKQE